MDAIDTLAVHHSASSLDTTVGTLKSWHTDPKPMGNGWSDIGYHWVIERDGALKVGRPMWRQGAHVRGHNTHCWGVCVVGDNTRSDREWTDEQKRALKLLIIFLQWIHPDLQVKAHNELDPKTECPGMSGAQLQALLASV